MTDTILRFDHIGIVTGNLNEEMVRMEQLFGTLEWSPLISDPIQKVDIRFGRNHDALVYELLFPNEPNSPLFHTWRKRKNILNHICYRVSDLSQGAEKLAGQGVRAITKPAPAIAYDNSPIQFFLHPEGWIIELVEGEASPFRYSRK